MTFYYIMILRFLFYLYVHFTYILCRCSIMAILHVSDEINILLITIIKIMFLNDFIYKDLPDSFNAFRVNYLLYCNLNKYNNQTLISLYIFRYRFCLKLIVFLFFQHCSFSYQTHRAVYNSYVCIYYKILIM